MVKTDCSLAQPHGISRWIALDTSADEPCGILFCQCRKGSDLAVEFPEVDENICDCLGHVLKLIQSRTPLCLFDTWKTFRPNFMALFVFSGTGSFSEFLIHKDLGKHEFTPTILFLLRRCIIHSLCRSWIKLIGRREWTNQIARNTEL